MPALNHDGAWSSGYLSIIRYLNSKSLGVDLDANLDASQRADVAAYSAYLGTHVSALLDLSLYVSAANWAATTRPAYSTLLSFPLTWTVPTLVRAEAIQRVEHLGLAELDSDFDPNNRLHLASGRDALPETFRKHLPVARFKKTVHEEMTPEQSVAIRLFSLTDEALSTLEDLLGPSKSDGHKMRFFYGTNVSSLDCLAFGYVALMYQAPVPRSFLKDWLESKAPKLTSFIHDMILSSLTAHGDLPWSQPTPPSVLDFSGQFLDSVVRHIPSVGDHYAGEMRRRTETNASGLDQRALCLAAGMLLTGLATGYGVHYYRQMPPFGSPRYTWWANKGGSKLGEFGALGSMLSSALGPTEPLGGAPYNPAPTPGRMVDMDAELD